MKPDCWIRTVLVLGILLILGLCTSCQKGKQLYPVHGQVLVDGKPPVGAIVVFQPDISVDPTALQPQLSTAHVKEDGSFTLTTYDPQKRSNNEGAYAGDYKVSVVWYDPKYVKKQAGETKIPDLLHNRYRDPRTSGLRAQVKEGRNDVPPFQLTQKPQ